MLEGTGKATMGKWSRLACSEVAKKTHAVPASFVRALQYSRSGSPVCESQRNVRPRPCHAHHTLCWCRRASLVQGL